MKQVLIQTIIISSLLSVILFISCAVIGQSLDIKNWSPKIAELFGFLLFTIWIVVLLVISMIHYQTEKN